MISSDKIINNFNGDEEDIEKDIQTNENDSNTNKTESNYDFKLPKNKKSRLIAFLTYWIMETLTTLGIVLGLMIGTASETAISTCSDSIGFDLNSGGNNTWISGGYTLTSLAFAPLIAKISSVFGRKLSVLGSILIFTIGCLGCALSSNMPTFITFRVIGGIGGGSLMALSYIMIADLTRPMQRPLYYGMINISFAIAAILGPIIGRNISSTNWRIIFYIFIPICFVYCIIVAAVLPLPRAKSEKLSSKIKNLDWLGIIVFIMFITGLNLICNWGGKEYLWDSVALIVTIVLTIISLLAFIYLQLKISNDPILPSAMFTRNIIFVNSANIFVGAINFIGISYFPIYYQSVHQINQAESTYLIIPFLILTGLFCMLSGFIARYFNSGRETMWFGASLQLLAIILLGCINQNSSIGQILSYSIINAFGVGLIKQLVLMVCQKTSKPENTVLATGFTTFSHTFGRVIGLAIITRVYNYFYTKSLPDVLLKFSPQDFAHPNIFEGLSSEQKEIVKFVSYLAFKDTYLCLIPFSVICIGLLLFLTKWPPVPSPS